jgi:hypothetical protein
MYVCIIKNASKVKMGQTYFLKPKYSTLTEITFIKFTKRVRK